MVIGLPFLSKTYKKDSIIDDYRILEFVGEGRFGKCYLVDNNSNKYILKEVKKSLSKKNIDKISLEKDILHTLDHQNIPKIIKSIMKSKKCLYILEYISGKTIEDIIFIDNHRFSYEEIYNIGLKLISTLEYIHSKNIVHRDIRIPNVIINEDDVYLIDFGLSRYVGGKYSFSEDFLRLGDLILYLYYSSFESSTGKSLPWYEELPLPEDEILFLKKLMELSSPYKDINSVKNDFIKIYKDKKGDFIGG